MSPKTASTSSGRSFEQVLGHRRVALADWTDRRLNRARSPVVAIHERADGGEAGIVADLDAYALATAAVSRTSTRYARMRCGLAKRRRLLARVKTVTPNTPVALQTSTTARARCPRGPGRDAGRGAALSAACCTRADMGRRARQGRSLRVGHSRRAAPICLAPAPKIVTAAIPVRAKGGSRAGPSLTTRRSGTPATHSTRPSATARREPLDRRRGQSRGPWW